MPSVTAQQIGTLPNWNLDDLYGGRDDPALRVDLDRAHVEAAAFRSQYEGKVGNLDGAGLADAIAAYENLQDLLGRIGSFAGLLHAGNMVDPTIGQFFQTTQEQINRIGSELVFFTLELNKIDDADLTPKMSVPAVARYQPWLRDVRTFRPHQLSDDIEKLLFEKYVSGRAAWVRLYDQTMSGLRFPIGGKSLTSAEALNLLSDPDRDQRREAADSLAKVLGESTDIFALIMNTLAKDKETEDRWRRFARPISSRNLANCIEDEVVDALIESVKASYPRLSHRYYALKAKWLGLDRLEYWDRNAPLPDDEDRVVPWDQAKAIVLGAYRGFSPQIADIGSRFFSEGWIDAPTRPGKAPGAFAHPTVPSAHPYILVNYMGRTRDVMTVAHELGHGVHQVLAGRQGALMADTPLTLAETASVFGEMLTFRKLLNEAPDPRARRIMLAGKVEDMLNTVVRQVAFADFERRIHDERRSGELTAEQIGAIWLEIQTESLGPAFTFADGYQAYWTYIQHFIHSPFYVYAYAFGDCLVNSLYAVYQQASDGFADRYIEMLSAGGTRRHKELLAPFGLDASDPAFWHKGLDVISSFIDELEALG
jgi:oligoendopeptidase F